MLCAEELAAIQSSTTYREINRAPEALVEEETSASSCRTAPHFSPVQHAYEYTGLVPASGQPAGVAGLRPVAVVSACHRRAVGRSSSVGAHAGSVADRCDRLHVAGASVFGSTAPVPAGARHGIL